MREARDKIFIIVRHGEYDEATGRLNSDGHTKVIQLAEKIKLLVGDRTMKIHCSPAVRAMETAQILGSHVGIMRHVTDNALGDWVYEDVPDEVTLSMLQMAEDPEVEVNILITHIYQTLFPVYWAYKRYGLQWRDRYLERGEGWLVSYTTENEPPIKKILF